jgi:hypothetical protein
MVVLPGEESARSISTDREEMEMTQARTSIVSAAVIALTFGIGGQTLTPVQDEEPLSTGDILIVTNETALEAGQSEDNAEESAKMGKEEGAHEGENLGAPPESDTAKVDQPPSGNPTTGNPEDADSVQQ